MKKITKISKVESKPLYCKNEETKAFRELLSKIGDKWSILLIVVLSRSPNNRARFSMLQKQVDGISQRMLTTTLRDLERDGLVDRHVYAEVPLRVEYELTPLGKNLLKPMKALVDWTVLNWKEIKKSQEKFDLKKAMQR